MVGTFYVRVFELQASLLTSETRPRLWRKPNENIRCAWAEELATRKLLISAFGYERLIRGGQSVTALPRCSDVDLLGNGERVIDLDAKISDRALHFGVPKEELNRAEVPGSPMNHSRLGSPHRMGAE